MSLEARIRDYYAALRAGDPLGPFFAPGETTVKVGISETLVGGDSVVNGLAAQTRETEDWEIESRNLIVEERESMGWFVDDVGLSWTETDTNRRLHFDTRWTGTLTRTDGQWTVVSMHVSAPHQL